MTGQSVSRWKRVVVFWLFVLVAAYAAYVYPVVSISRWLGYSQWMPWPVTIGLWALVILGLWCSFRGHLRMIKSLWVHWMGIGFVFIGLIWRSRLHRSGDLIHRRFFFTSPLIVIVIGVIIAIVSLYITGEL